MENTLPKGLQELKPELLRAGTWTAGIARSAVPTDSSSEVLAQKRMSNSGQRCTIRWQGTLRLIALRRTESKWCDLVHFTLSCADAEVPFLDSIDGGLPCQLNCNVRVKASIFGTSLVGKGGVG